MHLMLYFYIFWYIEISWCTNDILSTVSGCTLQRGSCKLSSRHRLIRGNASKFGITTSGNEKLFILQGKGVDPDYGHMSYCSSDIKVQISDLIQVAININQQTPVNQNVYKLKMHNRGNNTTRSPSPCVRSTGILTFSMCANWIALDGTDHLYLESTTGCIGVDVW